MDCSSAVWLFHTSAGAWGEVWVEGVYRPRKLFAAFSRNQLKERWGDLLQTAGMAEKQRNVIFLPAYLFLLHIILKLHTFVALKALSGTLWPRRPLHCHFSNCD